MRSALLGVAMACVAATPGLAQRPGFAVPAWAFPALQTEASSPARSSDSATWTLPHSTRSFTSRQVADVLNPVDWNPESHPPVPDVVIHARPQAKYACGLCHLPDGQGRSENATIAGLPADYIRRQIGDFRSGARSPAAEFGPTGFMKAVAVRRLARALTADQG